MRYEGCGKIKVMRGKRTLAIGTLLIFFLLSFNAYACLIPLYGGVTVAQGSDCTMPQEEQARQYCDTFKILGVQSFSSFQPLFEAPTHSFVCDLAVVPVLTSIGMRSFVTSESPPLRRNVLTLTSVLRI